MNSAKLSQQIKEAAALHQSGKLENAEKLYRAVLKRSPKQPDALHLLGVLLDQRGDRVKGISFVRQALAAVIAFPDAHINLARMLLANGEPDAAKQHYESALTFKPGFAPAYNGLGVLHRSQGAYGEAIAAFERAIRFDPRFLNAYINLCNTYRDSLNEARILSVADQALAIYPNNAPLCLLRSEAAFTVGHLADGWGDYEWRFKTSQRTVSMQHYAMPFWKGEDLASKSILIWCEQGVGDEIIFVSMVASVARWAKRCVLQTTPRLAPLFARSFPSVEVYGAPVPADIAATLDVQISMGGVGQWTRPTFSAFPIVHSYIKADSDVAAVLRAKYKALQPGNLVVGIAWRSTGVVDAETKTVDLLQWGAVLSIPGVTFVNLQYGDTREVIAAARTTFGVEIVEDQEIDALADLDAFAAQVAAMDLVVSTSTSAAHMAGALGVPVYCMVPRAMGHGRRWYWFGEGAYSPWYRSMTLFRQTQSDWSGALIEAGLALAQTGVNTSKFPVTAASLWEFAKLKLKLDAPNDALALIDKAIEIKPGSANLLNMRGMILARIGRLGDATEAYVLALHYAPGQAEVHNNLGTALRRMGRALDASSSYAKAHDLKPDHISIFLNYAMALGEAGKLEESLAALSTLAARQPDYVDAQYNRALALMALGKFEEGWKAFKWRLKRPTVHVRHEYFPQPVWAGEALADKHVLVWTDLGLGEEILAASIVPDLISAAKHVTLLCSERLVSLFRRSFPAATVDVRTSRLHALDKDIDFQMSMAELGMAFRRDAASFQKQKFHTVDEGLRNSLRKKYLTGNPSNLLVGISWRSVNPEIGAQKSIPLAAWLPILKIPGVTFVNLQYGDTREEIEFLRHEYGLAILNDTDVDILGDMDQVAAQVAAMDQVISISNTTVHLAGGLGIPTWILLPEGHARLWYWFRGLEQCAWYPEARFLTRRSEEDLSDLIVRTAEDFQRRVKARS